MMNLNSWWLRLLNNMFEQFQSYEKLYEWIESNSTYLSSYNSSYLNYNSHIFKNNEQIIKVNDFDGRYIVIFNNFNGQLHNLNGPAAIEYNSYGEKIYEKFFINGEELNEFEFLICREC